MANQPSTKEDQRDRAPILVKYKDMTFDKMTPCADDKSRSPSGSAVASKFDVFCHDSFGQDFKFHKVGKETAEAMKAFGDQKFDMIANQRIGPKGGLYERVSTVNQEAVAKFDWPNDDKKAHVMQLTLSVKNLEESKKGAKDGWAHDCKDGGKVVSCSLPGGRPYEENGETKYHNVRVSLFMKDDEYQKLKGMCGKKDTLFSACVYLEKQPAQSQEDFQKFGKQLVFHGVKADNCHILAKDSLAKASKKNEAKAEEAQAPAPGC